MSGPLSQVFEAIASGAGSRTDIVDRTGLAADVVDAAIDHLQRMGRLEAETLGSGCPTEGCGSCPSGTAAGKAGCGAPGPGVGRGPVLLKLTTGAQSRR